MTEKRPAIFERLHDGRLSRRAVRQRQILAVLASDADPSGRTRTGISRRISGDQKWQSVYPGIFKDMDGTMIPLGLVHEAGRLPVTRGPRIMQERGSPYYMLTEKGVIVTMGISETAAVTHLKEAGGVMGVLAEGAPALACRILGIYVEEWCAGRMELEPLDVGRLQHVQDDTVAACAQLMGMLQNVDDTATAAVARFLADITHSDEINEKRKLI